MLAFVEVLSGVIRGGPEAEKYGDPYDYAIAFSVIDGHTAVLKALTADGSLTTGHVKAALRALKAIGLDARWDRVR